mgnify:CR=1 FL=1
MGKNSNKASRDQNQNANNGQAADQKQGGASFKGSAKEADKRKK